MSNGENSLRKGTVLNDGCFEIEGILGQGGFGITYLAKELAYFRLTVKSPIKFPLDNPVDVVVKEFFKNDYCRRESDGSVSPTINVEQAHYEAMVDNQINEAERLKDLNHPNIVKVRDVFKANNTAYIAMELIKGKSVKQHLEERRSFSKVTAFKYILDVVDALIYLHEEGRTILHHDISPGNIMIDHTTDKAILIDFGIAKKYEKSGEDKYLFASSGVLGRNRAFAPIEQEIGQTTLRFYPSFDTYATIATLHNMLTGELLPGDFQVTRNYNLLTAFRKLVEESKVSLYVEGIIKKGLNPLFEVRYNSASELKRDLLRESEFLDHFRQLEALYNQKNYHAAIHWIDDHMKYCFHLDGVSAIHSKCKKAIKDHSESESFKDLYIEALEFMYENSYDLAFPKFKYLHEKYPGNAKIKRGLDKCQENLKERSVLPFLKPRLGFRAGTGLSGYEKNAKKNESPGQADKADYIPISFLKTNYARIPENDQLSFSIKLKFDEAIDSKDPRKALAALEEYKKGSFLFPTYTTLKRKYDALMAELDNKRKIDDEVKDMVRTSFNQKKATNNPSPVSKLLIESVEANVNKIAVTQLPDAVFPFAEIFLIAIFKKYKRAILIVAVLICTLIIIALIIADFFHFGK